MDTERESRVDPQAVPPPTQPASPPGHPAPAHPQDMQRRLRELTVLHEVVMAATSTLTLEQITARVTEVLQQSLGLEQLILLLVNDEQRTLEPPTRRNVANAPHTVGLQIGEGLLGWVAAHGRPLLVRDARHEKSPRPSDIWQVEVRSALVVPLTFRDKVIGVIGAACSQPGRFDAEGEQLLETVARQLAVALENARLYQKTERQLAEVSALYKLAQQIHTSLDVQEVLKSVVRSLQETLGCRGCSIALLNSADNALRIYTAVGIKSKWQHDFSLRLGEGIAGRVAQEGKPLYVPDTQEMEDFIFFDPTIRSLLTVPLGVKQRVIGTLSVDSNRPHAFSKADERLLTIAATQAAVAIENARLYTSLKQRADRLADAYIELQETERLKEEIIQNVSHELRTPLTFIRGYVELLLEDGDQPLTPQQREYLTIVARKADDITRLVGNIVNLRRGRHWSGKRMPVSLTEIARRSIEKYEPEAQDHGVTLRANWPRDGLPKIIGEPMRLGQVFDNLLDNAIKFSPDGGEVTISIVDTGLDLRVAISDQGIGIPAPQQQRIFDLFYQVDGSARRRFGGLGVGLAAAKRIVESHGGRIWVTSRVGLGSTFYFTIPKGSQRI